MIQIREVRKQHKLSQMELAKKVNVSTPFISEIEKGKKQPSLKTLKKLAAALNCTIDELVNGETSPGSGATPRKEDR